MSVIPFAAHCVDDRRLTLNSGFTWGFVEAVATSAATKTALFAIGISPPGTNAYATSELVTEGVWEYPIDVGTLEQLLPAESRTWNNSRSPARHWLWMRIWAAAARWSAAPSATTGASWSNPSAPKIGGFVDSPSGPTFTGWTRTSPATPAMFGPMSACAVLVVVASAATEASAIPNAATFLRLDRSELFKGFLHVHG